MATVFILQDKTWIERGHGLVRFVFDLRTFALRLVIRPGTPEEFECKLRPRIRSKGPRAYVVRAQAENGTDEHILAVRFEREEDSRSFRRFVEKRDVDHTSKSNMNPGPQQSANNYSSPQQDRYASGVQQSGYHRQHNRGSNVAQGGGYYPNGNPNIHHHAPHGPHSGGYGNSMMHPSYNNVSSPVVQKSSHHVQANYFWTCSRCLQMVDPTLHSCHVCGTPRQATTTSAAYANTNTASQPQVLQQISPNRAMVPYGHQHAQHPSAGGSGYGNGAAQPMHHLPPQQVTPSQYLGGRHGPTVTKPSHPTILKLTTVNLEKHNKLFPPKRRNVKEIVITQIDWLRKHGQMR